MHSTYLLHHSHYLRSSSSRLALSMSLRPSATIHTLRSSHGGARRPTFFPFLTYRALRTLAASPSRRIGFSASVRAAARSVDFNWPDTLKKGKDGYPYWHQSSRDFGRIAYDDYSEDEEFEIDSGQQLTASTVENVDDWNWKLTMLLRKNDELEIVSREKKDRRDFEQLAAMAARMGLHSRQYTKVVVFSKVPLPNYRSDLDDKRPQREVVLPFGLEKNVSTLLWRHISRKPTSSEDGSSVSRFGSHSIANRREVFDQQPRPSMQTNVTNERFLKHRSLQMQNKQQEWLVGL